METLHLTESFLRALKTGGSRQHQHVIYLSERNVNALLMKIDRNRAGGTSACTLIKYRQTGSKYCQSFDAIVVTATPDGEHVQAKYNAQNMDVIMVEDDEYYTAQNRPAGEMHPTEEKQLNKPSTGIGFGGPLL